MTSVAFRAGGKNQLVGLPVAWEDLRFPATIAQPTPGQTHPNLQTDPVGRLFRHTNTDSVYIVAQLPHGWKEGSELRPHVHWCKTTNNTGGVFWRLTYRWSTIGQVIDNAVVVGNSVPVISDQNTANVHALTKFGSIDATGRKVSDMLLMELSRVYDNTADNYGASALLLEFDIHLQIDTNGSRQEFTK